MGASVDMSDPWALSLEDIDPSEGTIFRNEWHYKLFERLRAEAPVHWSRTGPTGGFWSVTKYKDIMEVDKDFKTFSSQDNIVVGDLPVEFNPPMFIAKDPPIHDLQRKAAMPAVTQNRLAELEALIRERTINVLDDLPEDETFNWVEKVSIELTTQFLATLFDFPFEDRHLLPYWSDVSTAVDQVGNSSLDPAERQRILMECLMYFQKLWMERAAAEPRFDFISLLAHNPDTKDMINDPMDFLGNLMLLIIGGNDTTRNSMSAGVSLLHDNPAEYDKLVAIPDLIPNMVSEIIRYQTPLGHMRRTATQDTELGGQKIKKGDRVVMWYVSGNRDEDVFDNGNDFIIDRRNARNHMSFGFGIHRCMGNRAAEMQLRILWEEILARFERIEVVGDPLRVESNFVMGIEELPVIVKRKAG